MVDDDVMRGRIWTRREVLRVFGAAGVLALWGPGCGSSSGGSTSTSSSAGTSSSSGSGNSSATTSTGLNVVATPELTEGPYFVDEKLLRADLRAGTSRTSVIDGTPLALSFGVYELTTAGAVPVSGALVDVWHADAIGVYSDVGSGQGEDTLGQTWLRGYQISDADGQVAFTTIYPGWYVGRTIHIHFKVRTGTREFTSQLFFDDALSDAVMATGPYAGRGTRGVTNQNDGIYQATHTDGAAVGSHLLLPASADASGGYAAAFNVGLA